MINCDLSVDYLSFFSVVVAFLQNKMSSNLDPTCSAVIVRYRNVFSFSCFDGINVV
jgi:hypothetical protein